MKNNVILTKPELAAIRVNPLLDAKHQLKGIIIPISEKDKLLRPSAAQEIYICMSKLTYTPIHECSFDELRDLSAPVIQKVHQELLGKGLYLSYRNEQCVTPDLMIHEYQDRLELVSVDVKNGNISVKQVYQK
ncbi:MAG: hypothetical protein V4594_24600 [Bacteroidota bacterium]